MPLSVATLKETNGIFRLVFFASLIFTAIYVSLFIVKISNDDMAQHTSPTADLDSSVTSEAHSNVSSTLNTELITNVPSDLNAIDTNATVYDLTYFQKTREDKRFYELMELFDRVMTENGLSYFLYGGTLLGSYRHHGMVPWDDDLDVIVSSSLMGLVKEIFTNISLSDYVLYFELKCYWKLFSTSWDPIEARPWKFPFLDIFFYVDNESHIWDACPYYKSAFTYEKTMIFPLRRRPFMNLSLLAPRDARAVIAATYTIDVCQSNYFCHSLEQFINYTEVPCSRLHSMHPFVTRTYVNGGCNETLVDNGSTKRVFFDWGVTC